MSMAVNYHDVIRQMEVDGLDMSGFQIGTTKPVRCKVDGERGNKGWYWLHEMPFSNGDIVIVGSYGIWRGSENGAQKILLPEGSKPSREENAIIRKRIADNKKRMALELKNKQDKAAKESLRKWVALSDDGESDYLVRKQVRASGIRFTKDGAMAIPMRDVRGKLHGLQFVLDKKNPEHQEKIKRLEGDKRFWPTGLAMKGHFHTVGKIDPRGVNIVTEGYATADTLADASGLASVVAFNANNILPVVEALAKQYPKARWLVAADDDYLCRCQHCKKQTVVADSHCQHCKKDHGKINTGVTVAMKTCLTVDSAQWFKPEFLDRQGKKLSDFNDLMVLEGLRVVEDQVCSAIAAKFPQTGLKAEPQSVSGGAQTRGAGKKLSSMITVDEAAQRFYLIHNAKDMVYDCLLQMIVPLNSMKNILPDHAAREWKEHPERRVILLDDITFDATEQTHKPINLWGGFPTIPSDQGSCKNILEMLHFLVSGEENEKDVLHQVLSFLAYPLQHIGAKLDMCLLFQGVQGTGKSMLFEKIMVEIYQEYGAVLGQTELESPFNGWASKKLFIVADEILAKKDLFQVPGKIKTLITGKRISIRTLFTPAYNELNQINFVFLSNEVLPMVIDDKDRRFLVVKTPDAPLCKSFYDDIGKELVSGGIEAFYDYLLKYDTKDFNEHTRPLMTETKQDLIDMCKSSPIRFGDIWLEALNDDVKDFRDSPLGLPCCTCSTNDLYKAFRQWCALSGESYVPSQTAFVSQLAFSPKFKRGRVWIFDSYNFVNDGHGSINLGKNKKQLRYIEPVQAVVPPICQGFSNDTYSSETISTVKVLKFRRALDNHDDI